MILQRHARRIIMWLVVHLLQSVLLQTRQEYYSYLTCETYFLPWWVLSELCPIHTADADATRQNSFVASASEVCIGLYDLWINLSSLFLLVDYQDTNVDNTVLGDGCDGCTAAAAAATNMNFVGWDSPSTCTASDHNFVSLASRLSSSS